MFRLNEVKRVGPYSQLEQEKEPRRILQEDEIDQSGVFKHIKERFIYQRENLEINYL